MAFVQQLFATQSQHQPRSSVRTPSLIPASALRRQVASHSLSPSRQQEEEKVQTDEKIKTEKEAQEKQPLTKTPSFYPPESLLPPKQTPFGMTNTRLSPEQQRRDRSPPRQTQQWLNNFPLFSQEKRFRPSETWAAVSPNLPNMADVFPNRHSGQLSMYGPENNVLNDGDDDKSRNGNYFEQFSDAGDFYEAEYTDGGRTPSRSRTIDSLYNNSNNVSAPASAIDYIRSFSEQRLRPAGAAAQATTGDVGANFDNDDRQVLEQEGPIGSASVASATIASGIRSFIGGHDFESNPFSSTRNKAALARAKRQKKVASVPSAAISAIVSSGRDLSMPNNSGQGGDDDNNSNASSRNIGNNFCSGGNKVTRDDIVDDLFDEGGDPTVDEENSWLRNRLLAYGSTANPHSQRLFDKLAPEKLQRDREQMKADALAREAVAYQQATKLRAANNLLPPTPFSQKVPVLKGAMPNWVRRCDPALDLEAVSSAHPKSTRSSMSSTNRFFQIHPSSPSSEAKEENLSSDDSSDDDAVIFDEFLLKEREAAKNEKPRSEKRGDFYRLHLQPVEESSSVLKIHRQAPTQEKDPNQIALEFLAVSRPEFAPALRRLAPWQLQLIDWSSLFRGGTHQEVSVTAKRFPHGAPWESSPFSEAPVASGGLGFVGNLQRREKETTFFTKLHASNDGRVRDGNMEDWIKKCPIRFNVGDDD